MGSSLAATLGHFEYHIRAKCSVAPKQRDKRSYRQINLKQGNANTLISAGRHVLGVQGSIGATTVDNDANLVRPEHDLQIAKQMQRERPAVRA